MTPSLCWSTASKQLQQVVVKLVKESFGDTYYGKAMDCVKALREEAVRVSAREVGKGEGLMGWGWAMNCVKALEEEAVRVSAREQGKGEGLRDGAMPCTVSRPSGRCQSEWMWEGLRGVDSVVVGGAEEVLRGRGSCC